MGAWCAQSVSRGKSNRAFPISNTINDVCKLGFHGQTHRPDIEAIVAAGLFEECVAGIEAFVAGGTEQLHDVSGYPLVYALRVLLNCHSHPKCEARIRSMATALEFCIEHDIVIMKELAGTTASIAASIGEPVSATVKSLSCTCWPAITPTESLAVFPHSLCGVRSG